MGQAELLIAGLLVAVAGLSTLARFLSVPYPIVLVVGGALLGFTPGLPEVGLDPEVVLVVFLPPLLYGSSIYANFGDLRANLRALTLSTVGLVLATMCAVAWAAHALIPGLPWEAAFVLGAIVSPTDPLAAATIMRHLDAPRRLVSGIEGEGLFNDATALVAYRVAVAAVVAGSFSLAEAGLEFVLGAAGGVAVGLVVGAIAAEIRKRITDTQVNVTISLLTGYAAFVPADAIGASGVLATVTAGIYMGIRGPQILPARTRLQGYFVWDILDFIINAILFVLIGLQLRALVDGLSGYSASTLGGYALAVTGVVVGTRLVWYFTVPYLIRAIDRRPVQRARRVGARWRLVMAWSGMRGAVSLAVALALPFTTDAGGGFPERDLVVFLTFAVIFFTLVVQGLSLPALIRRLGVSDGGADADEEVRARLVATKAAIEQIDALAGEEWTRDETVERMRALYEYRKRRFAARAGKIEDDGYEDRSLAYQQIVQLVLGAQREALLRMRSDGKLSNEVMNRILRELDLEESRLEI
ncbi:MAG TPA: Na+/H+ antiporter [Rubrobacteraceae bacterium]|jgi:CPA1 family monovalent cation:H+ antiporter|nr:Na+/H+ antiporter [Rubrobacteraceae bacterium]